MNTNTFSIIVVLISFEKIPDHRNITILTRTLSFLQYGPSRMALIGTEKPDLVLKNSCDIKSLVGVTWTNNNNCIISLK